MLTRASTGPGTARGPDTLCPRTAVWVHLPLPGIALDISQHGFRAVRENSLVVICVPEMDGAECDQKGTRIRMLFRRGGLGRA